MKNIYGPQKLIEFSYEEPCSLSETLVVSSIFKVKSADDLWKQYAF